MRWLVVRYTTIPRSVRASIAIAMALYTIITGRTFLSAPLVAAASLESAAMDNLSIRWVYFGFFAGLIVEIVMWNRHFWQW